MGVKCLECARILPEMRENLLSRYANKMLNNGVLGSNLFGERSADQD